MKSRGKGACRTLALLLLAGCSGAGASSDSPAAELPGSPDLAAAGSVAAPPSASTLRPAFCARSTAADDGVRDTFCGQVSPSVRSLRELQQLLAVEPAPPDVQPVITDPYNVKFVIALGHSTALSGRLVSSINPRVIVIGKETVSAFQRGVQHVELAAKIRGRTDSAYFFYLVSFTQACNATKTGCSNADLFTPSIESDWTGFEIHDEQELANTPSDCRQCHQRASDKGVLLMRELKSPWTHFFEQLPASDMGGGLLPGARGVDLMRDYLAAKGQELYGNAAVHAIPPTSALVLQTVVPASQPLVFDSRQIEDERWPYGPDGYPAEPNPTPWWDNAYAAFKRGEQLALPYYDQRATDPAKLAQLTAAYAKYQAGELAAADVPNLADIFPDDPHVRAQIGLQTEPDATAPEALIQACAGCHNDVLDQSLSRARFNVDLSKLDASEIQIALDRLKRPRSMPGAMPPPDARQLDEATRSRVIEYLEAFDNARGVEPMLEHAAKVGMTGGGVTDGSSVYVTN